MSAHRRATALNMIAIERNRQIRSEGFTTQHDAEHENNELALAAAMYALPPNAREWRRKGTTLVEMLWPWEWESWKPTLDDRIRELVKAGALIVAEIERLQRARAS